MPDMSNATSFGNAKPLSNAEQEFKEYASFRVALEEAPKPFCRLLPDGKLEWNFHMGQRKCLESKKRIIAAIAGRQSGKSAIGPIWLYQEMRKRGPGLYMVVAPSYPLLQDSAIPKLQELFQTYMKLGEMRSNPLRFIFTKDGEKRLFANTEWAGQKNLPPTTIRFGHAANPESLEAKTALAAWLDEAGQDGFKLASWEAVEGRLTTTMGRVLISTTPYYLGWLKERIVGPWEDAVAEGGEHPSIEVIKWASIANPTFSREEYNRLKGTMPFWKWDMFYNGNFTVPAGLIYGIMRENEKLLKCKRSDIPFNGPRYGGLDFGGPNTCAVMAAKDPADGNIFLYRTYFPGVTMPIREHVKNIKQDEKRFDRFAGGARSEVVFREEFWDNGLRVEQPSITDLQAGIDRVYGLISQQRLHICEDQEKLWQEIYSYQYETDPDTGNVLDELKIKNKSSYHSIDALRYLCSIFGIGQLGKGVARAGGERSLVTNYERDILPVLGLREVKQPGQRIRVARSSGGRNTDPSGRGVRRGIHVPGAGRRMINFDD